MTRLKPFSGVLFLLAFLYPAFAAEKPGNSESITPGSYQIRNQKYGDLLRPEDANSADGTRIVLYPGQPWKCMTWKFNSGAASTFHLQNHFTSKTFAAAGSEKAEQPVVQVPLSKGAGERPTWKFSKLDDAYKITDAKSGKALTARKNGDTVVIFVAPWEDKPEQKWEVLKIDPKQLTM